MQHEVGEKKKRSLYNHSIFGPSYKWFQTLFTGANSKRNLHELILQVCLLKQDPSESYMSYM